MKTLKWGIVIACVLGSAVRSIYCENLPAPLPVLLERAQAFEEAGLMALARGEYMYILSIYPKEASVQADLKNISEKETKYHLENAERMKKLGALTVALYHANLAVSASPGSSAAKECQTELMKEISLQKGLQEKTSTDYLQGIKYYEAGQWTLALESFVKVLNMDPDHKGALSYVEKVGQKINIGNSR